MGNYMMCLTSFQCSYLMPSPESFNGQGWIAEVHITQPDRDQPAEDKNTHRGSLCVCVCVCVRERERDRERQRETLTEGTVCPICRERGWQKDSCPDEHRREIARFVPQIHFCCCFVSGDQKQNTKQFSTSSEKHLQH